MRGFLIKWFAMAVGVLAASYIIPTIVISDPGAAIIAALLLGLVNAVVRPVLVVLTLPFTILSLGLFLLVINAFMLELVAWLVDGFFVEGFLTAVIGSLVISIISSFVNGMLKPRHVG